VQQSGRQTVFKSISTQLLNVIIGLGCLSVITACGSGGGDGSGSAPLPVQLGAALPAEGDFIAIAQKSISLSEASRIGTVAVSRNGTTSGDSSVQYRFVSGSADLDTDFRGVTGTLSWPDGDSADRTIEFLVESDALSEGEETFSIELFGAVGSNELGINDSVNVTITDSLCNATIPATMGGNTVLSAPCYRLNGATTFGPSGQLTINPGTTVIAAAGSAITLNGTASLNSEGTASLPVVIKSANNGDGVWSGLELHSTSALHRIRHTEIRAAQNAVQLRAGGFAEFNYNVLRDTSGAGLVLPIVQADSLQTQNSFINTPLGIEIIGSDIDAGQSVSLPAQSTYYVLSNGMIVNGTLSLAAGTNLRMGADVPILVLGDGAISAVGTPEKPINISGVEARAGYWNGIQYVSAVSTTNRFEHTTIAHGGGDPARAGNIIVDGLGTTITMQNSALNDSAGYGIVYDSQSFQLDISGVSFNGNLLGDQSM